MQKRGGRRTRLVKGISIQQLLFKLDKAYVGKNTSSRPSSLNAFSRTEAMAVSSAASACKVLTFRESAEFF